MSYCSGAVVAVFFAIAAIASCVLGGGLICRLLLDSAIPSEPVIVQLGGQFAALSAVLLIAIASGIALCRGPSRRPLWAAISFLLSVFFSAVVGEVILRTSQPAWPTRALHGVHPQNWAAAVSPDVSGNVARLNLNSWGQRDRERTRSPRAGTRRVAFIGDSFLEEGADLTICAAVESRIGDRRTEIVNLGVSATGPDEYFERIRDVALPLGASHCYLFIFAGNDFVSPTRTLNTYCGIAAVEPRRSFLSTLGLPAWNFAFTNSHRPVIQAWMNGAQLARDELQRGLMLSQATDDQMRLMLLGASGLQSDSLERLAAKLNTDEMRSVYGILRNPDDGKFRSYYLSAALSSAADDSWTWEPNSDEITWQWTEQVVSLCARRKVKLTLVLIPEAFQIDDRMYEQWLPLADLRKCTAPCREAATRFARRARDAQLDIIDLHDGLADLRGTYLNLDGHWSESGVKQVAAILEQHWRSQTNHVEAATNE